MELERSRELVVRVEQLLEEIDRLPEAAGGKATEVVRTLLELYGAGLERIVEEVAIRDDGRLAEAFIEDELIAHLLLLHGLHPVPLELRVRGALDEVRPYLESHGGNVELLSLEGSTVHVALEGSCSGCPSSAMTLKLAIENAIHTAAPEIEGVLADGALEPAGAPPAGQLLQIELPSPPRPSGGQDESSWTMAGGIPELANGGTVVKAIAGQQILFLRVDGGLYGYRPRCPACTASLEGATLHGAQLACPGCAIRYDPLRAGRCLDRPQLHLDPVPLLVGDDGLAKVALAGGG